jgi:hypothetical protein
MDIFRDVKNSHSLKQAMVMILDRPSRIEERKKQYGIE